MSYTDSWYWVCNNIINETRALRVQLPLKDKGYTKTFDIPCFYYYDMTMSACYGATVMS